MSDLEDLDQEYRADAGEVPPKPNGAAAEEPRQRCLTPADWLARNIPPEDRLLGSLFTTTSRVQISADTGLGKTMAAVAFGFAMHERQQFLHWAASGREEPPRILYLDGEMPAELIQERIKLACEWFGLDKPPADGIFIASREDYEDMPALDTEGGEKWLFDFIANECSDKIDFIIFDNIAMLTQGLLSEEESAQRLKGLQRKLTGREIGQLWLHHTGLDTSRGYGSKQREWWLDTVGVMEKIDAPGADLAFKLRFPKARRKKPATRGDYEDVEIELREGRWLYREAEQTAKSQGKTSKPAQICRSALTAALVQLGQRPPHCTNTDGVHNAVTLEQWRDYYNRTAPYAQDQSDARRQSWRRGTEELAAAGIVQKWGEWVWLTKP